MIKLIRWKDRIFILNLTMNKSSINVDKVNSKSRFTRNHRSFFNHFEVARFFLGDLDFLSFFDMDLLRLGASFFSFFFFFLRKGLTMRNSSPRKYFLGSPSRGGSSRSASTMPRLSVSIGDCTPFRASSILSFSTSPIYSI